MTQTAATSHKAGNKSEGWFSIVLPMTRWIGELRDPKVLRADFIAGVTVALVLIPQSMAYAQLAGLPPYYGLYAAFLPPMVAALFGSSRQLATGPVAMVSLMTAAALEPLATAGGPQYIAYAVALALMVGVFQFLLGVLRMGALINFLAHPVIVGFTNAAAIIIATSQLGKLFGVSAERGDAYYQTVLNTVRAIMTDAHWPTFGFAVLAFGIMIGLKRINPRIPNVLVAVVVTTVLAWQIDFERKEAITPAQIRSASVTQLLEDIRATRADLARIEAEIAAAKEAYRQAEQAHGRSDDRTLTALHRLDLLRLQKQRRAGGIAADVKELKHVRFRKVLTGEAAHFVLSRDVPEAADTDQRYWRIHRIDDGEIVMNGGGHVVGAIPAGLPAFKVPQVDWGVLMQLISAAITISLIGFMEAISIAKAMATRTRQRLDANQELIGQGLSNMVGSLFQSYAVSGSFSRSAVNFQAGAVTGFSSVVTSLVVVVLLLWFTPLLYHLPQATLAAVIMMAVIGLVNLKAMRHAWHAHPHDGIVAIVTFVLTLALAPHLDRGILIGALLALGLYLYRTMKPRVAALSRHPDGSLHDAELYRLPVCENIVVIRYDGSLYFANTGYFEDKILERISMREDPRFVIVDAEGINQIDATGQEALRNVAEHLRKTGVELYIARAKRQVMDVLERSGLVDDLGRDHFFRRTEHAIEAAWAQLEPGHAETCPLRPGARPAPAAPAGRA